MTKAALRMVSLVAIIAMATISVYAEEVVITNENASLLKGKWKGTFTTVTAPGALKGEFTSTLEIVNDSVPFKGAFITFLPPRWGTKNTPFENGTINEKGELLIKWDGGERWLKLSLYKDGKTQLWGQFSWDNTLANLRFYKGE